MGRGKNLFYEPVPKRATRRFQIGSMPWEPQEYLDYFEQLPERPLYFEVDNPQELKIILDSPIWEERQTKYTRRTRFHLGINADTGFIVHVRSTVNGQPKGSGMSQGRSSSDLESALSYFNEAIARIMDEVGQDERLVLVEGKQSVFSYQDFHNSYLGLLHGTLDNPPALATPVDRQRKFKPREWLGRVSGGKHLHLRVQPGVWQRLLVSGWTDGKPQPGVSVVGLVLSEPEKHSPTEVDQLSKKVGDYFDLPEEDIVNLFEYPQCPGAEKEVDPRNLEVSSGEVNGRVNTVPNISYAEMNALFSIR